MCLRDTKQGIMHVNCNLSCLSLNLLHATLFKNLLSGGSILFCQVKRKSQQVFFPKGDDMRRMNVVLTFLIMFGLMMSMAGSAHAAPAARAKWTVMVYI